MAHDMLQQSGQRQPVFIPILPPPRAADGIAPMETYFITQMFDIVMVIVWMAGGILVAREFFRDYGGVKYEVGHAGAFTGDANPDIEVHDTEGYRLWQEKRKRRIFRGLAIFTAGLAIQLAVHFLQRMF